MICLVRMWFDSSSPFAVLSKENVTKESLEQAEDKERQAKEQEDQCNKAYVAALQDCKNRISLLLEQIEIWGS